MHVKPAYLHLPMIVVGVALNGFSIASARADSVLGMEAYSAPFYFWTDRMDMIDVRLRRNWPGSNEHATLRIPRGYIFFVAKPQEPQSGTSLPQRIDITGVTMALLHDRTESYVARLKDLKRQTNSTPSIRDTLRSEVAVVSLSYTVPPGRILLKRYNDPQYVDRGSFEGLIVTKLGSYGPAIDSIRPAIPKSFSPPDVPSLRVLSFGAVMNSRSVIMCVRARISWTCVCTAVCVMPTSACVI